jgi:protein-disulfide isomerase
MRFNIKNISAAICVSLLAIAPVQAGFDAAQKKEIEELVREYLLSNPEILREMSANLEMKERAAEDAARSKTLTENAAAIFKSPVDPVAGNPNGDVTIIEFMDYNCSWCKKAMTEIAGIVDADKNVKVIFKEFPIFGAGSEFAAKAALAAAKQGKYWELHQALFQHEGPVTQEVTMQLAEQVGLDLKKLDEDMKSATITKAITDTQALAIAMQINGTPAFIVDQKVFPGFVPKDQILAAVAEVRASGGCKLC